MSWKQILLFTILLCIINVVISIPLGMMIEDDVVPRWLTVTHIVLAFFIHVIFFFFYMKLSVNIPLDSILVALASQVVSILSTFWFIEKFMFFSMMLDIILVMLAVFLGTALGRLYWLRFDSEYQVS